MSKNSDNIEYLYGAIQNVETTGLDNVGDDAAVKNQQGTLTLRFIEESN